MSDFLAIADLHFATMDVANRADDHDTYDRASAMVKAALLLLVEGDAEYAAEIYNAVLDSGETAAWCVPLVEADRAEKVLDQAIADTIADDATHDVYALIYAMDRADTLARWALTDVQEATPAHQADADARYAACLADLDALTGRS
jgi:2-C-methyl-D-erythritol 4-phosphate cytidylyltransferase